MARKIKLTEKNLQQIVNRVIKESQLLNENMIEVECECGGSDDCMCYGSFDGSAADVVLLNVKMKQMVEINSEEEVVQWRWIE